MSIPNKLYYSISEVAEMTGVKAHVLRYWESEFSELRPRKNRAGNRSYRDKDIKMVITIRDLLYREGFTIQGARMQLKNRARREELLAAAGEASDAATASTPAPAARVARDGASGATAAATEAPAAARVDGALLRDMKSLLLDLRKRLD